MLILAYIIQNCSFFTLRLKDSGLHSHANVAFGSPTSAWSYVPGDIPSNLCSVVRLQLFSHILRREFHDSDTKHLSRKFTEWVYGPITCSLYDLASVDSYQNKSVLEILVYGSDIPVSPISTSPPSAMMEIRTQLSSVRTATRCSRRTRWASCWSQSGRSLQVICSV